jgi:hypothetical protein
VSPRQVKGRHDTLDVTFLPAEATSHQLMANLEQRLQYMLGDPVQSIPGTQFFDGAADLLMMNSCWLHERPVKS